MKTVTQSGAETGQGEGSGGKHDSHHDHEPLAEPGASEVTAAAAPSKQTANAPGNLKKGHDDPFSWQKEVPKKLHSLGNKCIQADRTTAAADKSSIEANYDEGASLTQFKKALKDAGVKRAFEKLCDSMGIDPNQRKRAMRIFKYLSANGGRSACSDYSTRAALLRHIADSANNDSSAGPATSLTAARKGRGGAQKPKTTDNKARKKATVRQSSSRRNNKDEGQKAREAKRKLAESQGNGADKTKVGKLAPDGERLAADGAAVPRLLSQSEKEDQVTDTFFKAAQAMKECCGWKELIDTLAEQLTNEEIELVIERLDKLIHPAAAKLQIDVPEAIAVLEEHGSGI